MRAAIYARYSSESQRPESIADQIKACRRLAAERASTILDDHIYFDEAKSGARRDRLGLSALIAAGQEDEFDVVLVDDLSRLVRDNNLMLSVIAELHFEGVRVVSVADGLDSEDEEATLGIQIRGIFDELQLRDLRKKTLRGQIVRRSGASRWVRGPSATAPCPWGRSGWTRRAGPARTATAVGLEQDGAASRPAHGEATQVPEAEVRVDHP